MALSPRLSSKRCGKSGKLPKKQRFPRNLPVDFSFPPVFTVPTATLSLLFANGFPSLVLGNHGCDQAVANKVVNGRERGWPRKGTKGAEFINREPREVRAALANAKKYLNKLEVAQSDIALGIS